MSDEKSAAAKAMAERFGAPAPYEVPALRIDPKAELSECFNLVEQALGALFNEHEGDFRSAIEALEFRADRLGQLVRSW